MVENWGDEVSLHLEGKKQYLDGWSINFTK